MTMFRCTSCSKPITGQGGTRFISFEGRHWHSQVVIIIDIIANAIITIFCPAKTFTFHSLPMFPLFIMKQNSAFFLLFNFFYKINLPPQCFLCALCKKSMAGRGFITGSNEDDVGPDDGDDGAL